MITVCLNIYKKNCGRSVRQIEDFRTISGLRKTVEYISKYPDVDYVSIDFKEDKHKEAYKRSINA